MKKIFICMILSILTFSNVAFAEDFAKLTNIEGSVNIKRAGGEKTFKAIKNMRILEGDIIITGTDGKATVMMSDKRKFVVDTNSKVNIETLKKNSTGSEVSINVKTGTVYTSVKNKLGTNDKYNVSTPNAVAGIRGTEFLTVYKPRNNQSTIDVVSGVVNVSDSSYNDSVDVKKESSISLEKTNDSISSSKITAIDINASNTIKDIATFENPNNFDNDIKKVDTQKLIEEKKTEIEKNKDKDKKIRMRTLFDVPCEIKQ